MTCFQDALLSRFSFYITDCFFLVFSPGPCPYPRPRNFGAPWTQPSAFFYLSTFLSRDLIQSHGIYTGGFHISISSWTSPLNSRHLSSTLHLSWISNRHLKLYMNKTQLLICPQCAHTQTHTHDLAQFSVISTSMLPSKTLKSFFPPLFSSLPTLKQQIL